MSDDHLDICTEEGSFTTCPPQISMSFGYVVGSYECNKTLKWFDSMATFAPATPTQRHQKHEKIPVFMCFKCHKKSNFARTLIKFTFL